MNNIFKRNKKVEVKESTELKEAIFTGSNNSAISALFPTELSRVLNNSAVWVAV